MKTRLIPILTAALAAGSTITAFADLSPLDSAQFDYKYEMLKLPTAENLDGSSAYDFTGGSDMTWCTLGTGADIGTVLMDMSKGNKSFTSSAAVGSAGDLWKTMNATHGTGYTIETRLKVSDVTGTAGAFFLNASLSGGNYNAFLYFFANQLKWGGTVVTNMSTASWHTYRIVRIAGEEKYHLYVDGFLVKDDLGNSYSGTLDRLIFGAGGANYKSKVRVAYLRLTKGAYAPLSRRRSSSDFPVQYEMKSNDGRFATDGNAKQSGTEWTASVGTAPTVSLNNWLSMDPNGINTAYWVTKDAVWKSIVMPSTPYTVEFRTKIKDCNIAGIDRSLNFLIGTSGPVASLFVGTHTVEWQVDDSMGHNITLDATSDNTDAWHTFRITYSGGGRHAFTVWRDGVKIGEDLVDCTNFYQYKNSDALAIVRFGVVSTKTHGGEFDIDYIRWDTTGAYDWKDPRKGLQIKIR